MNFMYFCLHKTVVFVVRGYVIISIFARYMQHFSDNMNIISWLWTSIFATLLHRSDMSVDMCIVWN